jgi:hypothetical protein
MTRVDEPAVLETASSAHDAAAEHDFGARAGPHAEFDALTPRKSFAHVRADVERMRRALAASTCVMAAWSIFEAPWEFDMSGPGEQTAAVVVAKTLLLVIAGMSLRGKRWARYLLFFVCLTSVFAIAPELPAEFQRAPWLAFLSSVECAAKLAALVLLGMVYRATRERNAWR